MGHTQALSCANTVGRFIPTYVGHTLTRPVDSFQPFRFIPTYVGHTTSSSTNEHMLTVHPHIRGAYRLARCMQALYSWFIPTYVGHTALSTQALCAVRFIPTYVGHTTFCRPRSAATWVHPHIRGAYRFFHGFQRGYNGSSPHTWGIRSKGQRNRKGQRFIPTYVGHTHVYYLFHGAGSGSSPHTWGIQLLPSKAQV